MEAMKKNKPINKYLKPALVGAVGVATFFVPNHGAHAQEGPKTPIEIESNESNPQDDPNDGYARPDHGDTITHNDETGEDTTGTVDISNDQSTTTEPPVAHPDHGDVINPDGTTDTVSVNSSSTTELPVAHPDHGDVINPDGTTGTVLVGQESTTPEKLAQTGISTETLALAAGGIAAASALSMATANRRKPQ